MFFNEATHCPAETKVLLPVKGSYAWVDLLGKRTVRRHTEDGRISLSLQPYESVVLVFDGEDMPEDAGECLEKTPLDLLFDIDAAHAEDLNTYYRVENQASLHTIEGWKRDFAGRVRYRAVIRDAQDIEALELTRVGDTAQLLINGRDVGRRICPPYRFDVKKLWQKGENQIEIVVSTTLGRKIKDRFSTYMPMNRPGLSGKLLALKKK